MEKNHYKFIRNQKPLSDGDIAKHKDFDALMAQMGSSTLPKKKSRTKLLYWLGPVAAAAAVIGWLLFPINSGIKSYEKAEMAFFEEKPFVDPPLPQVKAEFVSNKVDAYDGGIFEYKTGSKVIIPKAAFINEAGEVIGGEVEILYREYHDYVDFFLSGIPMQYDSLGNTYQLESAGMVEIYAEQDGKRLNVAPGKALQVELSGEIEVSSLRPDDLPSFNIYQLDVPERNWSYQGLDNITFTDNTPTSIPSAIQLSYSKEIEAIKSKRNKAIALKEAELPALVKPNKPVRANDKDYTFDLAFNDIADESLQGLREEFEGSLWQVIPGSGNFDAKAAGNIEWEDMELKKINTSQFQLTLFSGGSNMKVNVRPVLTGSAYESAMNDFNQELEKYETAVQNRSKSLATALQSINRKYDALMLAAKNSLEDETKTVQAQQESFLKRKVLNKFAATSCGIWNCDRPTKPFKSTTKGDFVNETNQKLPKTAAFLVEKNRNTVSKFLVTEGAPVKYNKGSASMMWMVTPDNKIAIFSPEEFEKIQKGQQPHKFVFKTLDQEIKNEEDVRSLLEF